MFYFYAGTNPQRYQEVLEEFALEIARVQSGGVGAEELRRCQTRLKAGKRMAMQTNSSRALQAAHSVICGLPVNDWRNYEAHIEAVTPALLQSFAQKYFQPALRTQMVVKP
jgi:zinc protease